jgi:hypothetical protein
MDDKTPFIHYTSKVQAGEITYELHTLGWKAFQNLCVTIISDVWGQIVQSFYDSRDGGRDGAFHGTWKTLGGESFQGSFTVQCKFTSIANKLLLLSDLKDEYIKAKRLASHGLADNYILFTNARITGTREEQIRLKFEGIPNIQHFAIYGRDRISQLIHESPRLRMLVPRIYGLGDLSQILDQRAYDQAREILLSYGDDLSKFVITDAFRKSAKALVDHGFVLLLGEPASGKSTIAAALSLGALDEWGCSTIKIRDADEFVMHSNPHEPKQFFWEDDAFGTTQLDWENVFAWNRVFPHLHAAIRRGARVVFTSRDYIYRSARQYLKESAFPLINESQVVIHVEELSTEEREQILYNHIKLGTQPKVFKTKIKPFLLGICEHHHFSPEIARRLGNPVFTKQLSLSKEAISDFVAHPLEFLCDIIRNLDAESWSAIALLFIHEGTLQSPIEMTEEEQKVVSLLGGSVGGCRKALNSLDKSILIRVYQNDRWMWRFKHPTIRDAFATLVSEDIELMNIYLAGAPIETIFKEVSCGDVSIQGVKVIIPNDHFKTVVRRIEGMDLTVRSSREGLYRFLAHRCNKEFLSLYISRNPNFIPSLQVSSYLSAVADFDVIMRLHEFALLPELKRVEVVAEIKQLAITIPDSGFLQERYRQIFLDEELPNILEDIRTSLFPYLDELIDNWISNYDHHYDPEGYFDELKMALQDFGDELVENKQVQDQLKDALIRIDNAIEELRSEEPEEPDYDVYPGDLPGNGRDHLRSIFDDIDL